MSSELQLTNTKLLPDFPSGSSINYHAGKLFLIGDDAREVLILDKDYNKLSSIPLFDYTEKRIPKADKTDLEASFIINLNNQFYLIALGSASKDLRKKVILIPLAGSYPIETVDTSVFTKRIKSAGLDEINLEGATEFHSHVILSNRGNRSRSKNHLIVTDKEFWINQREADISVVELKQPIHNHELLGVSELHYIDHADTLLITMSSEKTNNAYDDGEIGDSYIGWIIDFSKKLNSSEIHFDRLINLADCSSDFIKEKIEGICVESFQDGECIAHLVSDNDDGESKLFKIKLKLL